MTLTKYTEKIRMKWEGKANGMKKKEILDFCINELFCQFYNSNKPILPPLREVSKSMFMYEACLTEHSKFVLCYLETILIDDFIIYIY